MCIYKRSSVLQTQEKRQCLCSDVLYCVETSGFGKLIFGHGTKLTIQMKEEREPTFYTLKKNGTTACLATDFSKHDAVNSTEPFEGLESTRLNGEKLFSAVAIVESEDVCEPEHIGKCESTEAFETDEKFNFLSLTILGLRILFLKTIIFNVLMTIRICIRQ
uniref:Uncharacterized protein n=1 Tax=Denticeps clupeoides TaxID=299321 RepID=A0AAY4AEW3_9TELE